MWANLLTALALVLVIEGILPFLSPAFWRAAMLHLIQRPNKKIRLMGLISMLVGTIVIVCVHSGWLA